TVPKFELSLDMTRRLLTVVMRGFWDAQVYKDYDEQLTAQLRRVRLLGPPMSCLVDASEFAIQSKEIADLMREGIAKRLHLYPSRTARLVSCAISRGQAARMTSATSHRVFDSREAACEWLLDRTADAA
ncbi:MAG TPA: hypothetical protein VNT42_05920, partial [Sphingomonas sp.]|nr:hypothetical protein [Sphingomonas sp.]